ncbi:hypothetical protein CBL_11080 [Carabus blaptoides fortunei]
MKFVLLLVVVTVLAAHLVEAKKGEGRKGKHGEHRPATQEKSAEHEPPRAGDTNRTRRAAPADAGTKGTEKKDKMKHRSDRGKPKPKA